MNTKKTAKRKAAPKRTRTVPTKQKSASRLTRRHSAVASGPS